jgi:hypothetical protein
MQQRPVEEIGRYFTCDFSHSEHLYEHGMLDNDIRRLICQNEKLLYSFFNVAARIRLWTCAEQALPADGKHDERTRA